MNDKAKRDFREDLTNKLIKQVEQGTAPWQKPWDGGAIPLSLPHNATTGRRYRGGNVMGLLAQGYSDPRWCTYKQAAEKGWQVRKGEKGTGIEYWKFNDNKDNKVIAGNKGENEKTEARHQRPVAFYATVFNVEQMDNVPPLEIKEREVSWNPVESAEKILQESKANIQHLNQDKAYYRPSTDEIHLPPKSAFPDAPKYYATALHELGHWTGHETRLNRDLSGSFGSEKYAREELRAEMASLFLSAELGLPFDPSRHAAYQASWIKALKEDKNEIFRAARDAENIADYVVGLGVEKKLENEQNKSQKVEEKLTPNTPSIDSIVGEIIKSHYVFHISDSKISQVDEKLESLNIKYDSTSLTGTDLIIFTENSPYWQNNIDRYKAESLGEVAEHLKENLKANGVNEDFKLVSVEDAIANQVGNKFTGEISAVTDMHVVQKIGANKYVAHELSNLPDKQFEVGKNQTLQYSQGKAQLIERDIKKSMDKNISR